jgi:hypothetical protein
MQNPMLGPRCETELDYVGTKTFHEGSQVAPFRSFGRARVRFE